MIDANDLMLKNIIERTNFLPQVNALFSRITVTQYDIGACVRKPESFRGIPLTEQILVEWFGFEKLKTFNTTNSLQIKLGRRRVLSVSSVGTPNEMVFLSEVDNEDNPTEVIDIVAIRNYDYDGKTYAHDIQNIYKNLTRTDLPILSTKK